MVRDPTATRRKISSGPRTRGMEALHQVARAAQGTTDGPPASVPLVHAIGRGRNDGTGTGIGHSRPRHRATRRVHRLLDELDDGRPGRIRLGHRRADHRFPVAAPGRTFIHAAHPAVPRDRDRGKTPGRSRDAPERTLGPGGPDPLPDLEPAQDGADPLPPASGGPMSGSASSNSRTGGAGTRCEPRGRDPEHA